MPDLVISDGVSYSGGRARVVICDALDADGNTIDIEQVAERIWTQEDVRDRIRHWRKRGLIQCARRRPVGLRLSRQTRSGRTSTSRRIASHRRASGGSSDDGGSSDGSGPSSPTPREATDRAEAVAR